MVQYFFRCDYFSIVLHNLYQCGKNGLVDFFETQFKKVSSKNAKKNQEKYQVYRALIILPI